jgi:inosine triphosphate pyrophosphatase
MTITNMKIDLPELQGDPLDIAREKCKLAAKEVGGGAVITEDTSLCYNALNGMPGPYSKYIEREGEGWNGSFLSQLKNQLTH